MQISKKQARQFILAYQGLLPPRQLAGKAGIMEYVCRVGCLQYDPLDMVGTNPNLVLQSRVRDYRPQLLAELLYSERSLVDGWDKNTAIFPVADWPYFCRYRNREILYRGQEEKDLNKAIPRVLEELREKGPLSSTDFVQDEKVNWFWGPAKASRAALEILWYKGEVIIFKRIRQRRVYDLACRHIPEEILFAQDPNPGEEEYCRWHVKRRINAIGLLWNKASDAWLGIRGLKTPMRNAAFASLEEQGEIVPVEIEGLNQLVYIARENIPLLREILTGSQAEPQAAFLAPLDNMLWDRKLIAALFGFEYTWEVYKPARQRQYGYYVLPVLYGDRFVARFEPRFNKKTGVLDILNWWWEPGIEPSEAMWQALNSCLCAFMSYLGATGLERGNWEGADRLGCTGTK